MRLVHGLVLSMVSYLARGLFSSKRRRQVFGRRSTSLSPRPPLVRSRSRQGSVVLGSSSAASEAGPIDLTGDGKVLKTMVRPGLGERLTDGSVAVVRYRGALESGLVYSTSQKDTCIVGDGSMIPGWDVALNSMSVGEQAAFTIDPSYGYGPKGVAPVIPPDAPLFLEVTSRNFAQSATPSTIVIVFLDGCLRPVARFMVEVLGTEGESFNDVLLGGLFEDPDPMTPDAIKADFERRLLEKTPEREGFDGFLDWVKSIYVFGFFDAPAGGQTPWVFRPLVVFPIILVSFAAAFYVVVASGSVSYDRPALSIDSMAREYEYSQAAGTVQPLEDAGVTVDAAASEELPAT